MKEYEIHSTATYTTDGGTTEGSYFVEYVAAKNIAEVERILRAELKDARYKNIKGIQTQNLCLFNFINAGVHILVQQCLKAVFFICEVIYGNHQERYSLQSLRR